MWKALMRLKGKIRMWVQTCTHCFFQQNPKDILKTMGTKQYWDHWFPLSKEKKNLFLQIFSFSIEESHTRFKYISEDRISLRTSSFVRTKERKLWILRHLFRLLQRYYSPLRQSNNSASQKKRPLTAMV